MKNEDEKFMRRAVSLSLRGSGNPSSLRRVGIVVVAGGQLSLQQFGSERGEASTLQSILDQCGGRCEGASIYSNVEPWNEEDTDATLSRLIAASPSRLVVGVWDSSPADRSWISERLRRAGVAIDVGVCEDECRRVNEAFLKYRATGSPFVTLKFAQSLDGRLATASGNSQWISSPASLKLAHQLRCEHDCVMVGIGTVLADDPQLTVRLVDGRNPLRVVVDSRLRVPIGARLLREGAHLTLIATTPSADRERASELEAIGAEVLTTQAGPHKSAVDLQFLLREIGRRGVASVLVEGGAGLITSLLAERLADRMVVVVAPKILGRGVEAIGDLGISRLDQAITFSSVRTFKLGPDMVFDGLLAYDACQSTRGEPANSSR